MLLKPKEGTAASASDNTRPVDVRGLQKQRVQNLWTWRPLTLLTTALALVSLAIIVHSSLKLQLDPQGCIMSMMLPTYIKLSGFDTEHSRFATKYSLYLYREEGVDEYSQENIGLRGAPVLFIPGNAGSYKQVRSLSSEGSRYYYGQLQQDPAFAQTGVRPLDFFTIDFNEDLAAFHGQTLIDQAEYVNEAIAYILALYHDVRKTKRDPDLPDPTSVILIGHSMGGFVARTVLVTPKYQANSVNTIITMSTPHARPPVSFDADLVSLYQQVNDYWREAYLQKRANNNPLYQTTLISIAGGGRDTTVPSDYCSTISLIPETHGLTVFTSGVPNVWTSMDHLAIIWADQIRKTIIKSLYEVVDVRRAAQTKSRAERMRIFKKWFLTGLEESLPKSLPTSEHDILLTLGGKLRSPVSKTPYITIARFGAQDQISAQLLPIPVVTNKTASRLSVMTNQLSDSNGNFEKAQVLFCSTFPISGSISSAPLLQHIDLSNGDTSATRLACKRAKGDIVTLPASTRSSKYSYDREEPFSYLQYDVQELQNFQFLAVVDTTTEISNKWLHAEIASTEEAVVDVKMGLPRLLLRGINLELPPSRPMMAEIRVPALHSSLLAYNLKIRQHGCDQDAELFTPLLRQYIETPYESKFFVNFKEGEINLHGIAPFMPPGLDGQEISGGLSFQIWSDPTCNSSLEFRLRPDWIGSLGKLVIRYRTVFAAFPLLVVAMVLRKQFRIYDNTGIFISFNDSLDQSLRLPLPVLLLSMTFFATAFTNTGAGSSRDFPAHVNATINFEQNDLLLGSQDSFFWFLVPLTGLLSIGACVLLNYIVLVLLQLFTFLMKFNPSSLRSKGSSTLYTKDSHEKVIAHHSIPSFASTNTSRRRLINTAVLILLVATIIPYPFAYAVACIVQFATTTRALAHFKLTRSAPSANFFNYTHSILILMLWVLPINLPTLIVWIHNLAVHWLTPFSSHHNVLSILPFILLVETLTSGTMVPAMKNFKWTTNILFFVLAVYAAVYGMTYAYRLHYIANIIALWLVLLHFVAHKIRSPSSSSSAATSSGSGSGSGSGASSTSTASTSTAAAAAAVTARDFDRGRKY